MSADRRFDEIYRDGWAHLIGLLISIGATRADAEEIAQGAYEKLWRSWASVSGFDDPQAWVRRVAVRDVISRARRARTALLKRPKLSEPDWLADPADRTVGGLDLVAMLRSLSTDHRAVLFLHYVEDLSVDVIADELGISPGPVKSRLSRARSALAQLEDIDGGRK